ncbi:S1C family serine protease [Humisphaera borealis]|uniref:Trypsin-like peptidase domain-containing protein n=1 Tax=Humisphaera borealis TaxID=2807512 RepID=A0A7M2WUC9_9BACT|nr:trypsin-like peptidase domain-containing protein [Humisphaera borealis]QOV89127.1 trypsin-like peptidase domain-containing protein [Humisphaera borealis]
MKFRATRPLLASVLSAVLATGLSVGFQTSTVLAQDKPAKPTTAPASKPTTKPATAPAVEVGIPKAPVAGKSELKSINAIPESLDDLKALEARVAEITKKVLPAVVGVQAGSGQGSGVIVGSDGFVLTAGHVSGEPGRDMSLILTDGRRVRARSLGVNSKIDSGLIKITDKGTYPSVKIGKSADLKKGQWVLALGHPGGYQRNRPPVLRLGRVLAVNGSDNFVMTDCTLVGGDSGGPLFDLDGNVVAIHSRIGPSTLNNMHTPSDTYVETWDRLVRGESWGSTFAFLTPRGPMLGIGGESAEGNGGAVIGTVTPGSPAEKAGIKPGDIVVGFDGKPVQSLEELAQSISRKSVGDKVAIELVRNGKKMELSATLARRPRE